MAEFYDPLYFLLMSENGLKVTPETQQPYPWPNILSLHMTFGERFLQAMAWDCPGSQSSLDCQSQSDTLKPLKQNQQSLNGFYIPDWWISLSWIITFVKRPEF